MKPDLTPKERLILVQHDLYTLQGAVNKRVDETTNTCQMLLALLNSGKEITAARRQVLIERLECIVTDLQPLVGAQ